MANYERANSDRGSHDRANHDREERVFDGGQDEDENEGSHLPVVIIIAILVLAAFGGVVWLAYNQGIVRGRSDVPLRTATTQTATAQPGDNGIKVYQQRAGTEEEAPQPQAAQPQAPVQSQAPAQPPAAPQPVVQPVQAQAPKPQVAPPVQMPAAKPQTAPAPVATRPPAVLGGANPAIQTPRPAAVAPTPVAASAGGAVLQIGAFKSEEEARTAWRSYAAKHAGLVRGFGPDVQRADLGPKGVWYRLRIAGIADKAAAAALCERLKADGGTCLPVK